MTHPPAQTIIVPGYEGRGALAPRNSTIRVTDTEGSQVGDFFVMAALDPEESFSPGVTHLVLFHLFPAVGEPFYSNLRRPLLTLLGDHSPGTHDTTFAPCDAEFYESLGHRGHPNCRDNFFRVAAPLGIVRRFCPDPINLFQNSRPNADGTYSVGPTPTQPGDYIEFRADTDLVVVLTACSVDLEIGGCLPNGPKSTALRLEITPPGPRPQ
jgi:uncharacterized protein